MFDRRRLIHFIPVVLAACTLVIMVPVLEGCSKVSSVDKPDSSKNVSKSLPSATTTPMQTTGSMPMESTPATNSKTEDSGDTAPTPPETTPTPPTTTPPSTTCPAPSSGYEKGLVGVQFKEGVSEETAREIVQKHCGTVHYLRNTRQDAIRLNITVRLSEGKDESEAAAEFEAEPTVEYAERVANTRPTG